MTNIQYIDRRPIPHGWRERWMSRFKMNTAVMPLNKNRLTIPNWFSGPAMMCFFVALFASWMVFGYVPEFALWMAASVSIVLFFYVGQTMSRSLGNEKEKSFLKTIFIVGIIVRLVWAFYGYFFFNMEHYGYIYGDNADTGWYMDLGKDIAQWLSGNSQYSFSRIISRNAAAVDDTGYPFWLGIVYLVSGVENDVALPFILKCIMGAYCSILIYRIAKRHFDEGTARITAIFICLNPNMIYWCGAMMKETEMVFVTCIALDNFDKALSSGARLTLKNLWPGILAGLYLFFIRTALGLAIFIAVFAHVVFASHRIISLAKKILASILVLIVLAFSVGDRVFQESKFMYNAVQSDGQKANMEWRSERQGGNAFAKYAGAAVFAPLIFTLPFPTFNQAQEDQLAQVQLAGGSYIKNILSYFVLVVMAIMLISGEWRNHVFILAYTLGYLSILVVSSYAQSGRFHMPIIPMLMMFAAYGVQIAKCNVRMRKWFPIVLIIEIVACLGWNWFKLKGRGMI